jgi:uncharacterized repeat protein (TIGR03803 family)
MRLRRRLLVLNALLTILLMLMPSGLAAPKYKILHAFGQGQDGAGIWGSLLLDKKGNLYGTTGGGGLYGYGTAFRLAPKSNGNWSETILHDFDRNGQDGYGPTDNLTFRTDGNLYGTTTYGGTYDYGMVFELKPGSSGWTENVVYNFGSHQNDGFEPYAGLVLAPTGDLFGTTPHDPGNVFQLTLGSQGWTERVIDTFSRDNDGNGPFAGLILGATGSLYGITENGGAHNLGVVYELSPRADGSWKERILHDFCPTGPPYCPDGARPGVGALTMDSSGNIYGATAGGGYCCGTVFRLTLQADGRWKETVLYDFKGGASGFEPGAGVVRDNAGALYGTTVYGGRPQCDCGVVFKLSPRKSGRWEYSVLHTFTGYDGAQPDANLILDTKGNLYGTAATGGASGGGVAFEITP